ncbi:MAG: phenylphosphate carboxylase subunit delta [Zoogloea sp.]|nr:phenylphosphate carboxylase subunit delta [Zoogloea sp.]
MSAIDKAARLQLMAFDVDGVMTDGSLYFTPNGDEIKSFNSLDGHGIKMLMSAGIRVAIISGRRSRSLELRAENLGIALLHQGVSDKRAVLKGILDELGLAADCAGYMGDDVVDLPILRCCGFSATPGDGHEFVKRHVDYIARLHGGRGAVREVTDFILAAQGKLDRLHADMLA